MTFQPHSADIHSRVGRIAGRDGAISSGTYSPAMASERLSVATSSEPHGMEYAGGDSRERPAPYSFRWLTTAKPGRLTRYTQSRPGLRPTAYRGTFRGQVRGFNFGGLKCRFVSGAPLKPAKQSKRRLSKCFRFLSWFLFHEANHEREFLKCLTKPLTKVSR